MALQKLGDRLRVLALLLHAQAKRLGSLQRVEGRLRRHDVAVHVLHVPVEHGKKVLSGPVRACGGAAG
eukprot:3414619-Pleurochrysis_carterae.AAC.5